MNASQAVMFAHQIWHNYVLKHTHADQTYVIQDILRNNLNKKQYEEFCVRANRHAIKKGKFKKKFFKGDNYTGDGLSDAAIKENWNAGAIMSILSEILKK